MPQKCCHKIFFWTRTIFNTKLRNFVVVNSSKRQLKQGRSTTRVSQMQEICKFFASFLERN